MTAAAAQPASPPALNRSMITATVMLASILQSLDNTIATVALPHMQGELSATSEQMSWVLTSYIVATAIMTPLTGWLATRFGRRELFFASILGFTLASVLCAVAQTLPEMVLFRTLQGLSGAALVPMSQATLFDINPPERHGSAMAMWGAGVLIGPMLGPILGGWLTDHYSWRWVFYINVPLGAIAILGLIAYFPKSTTRRTQFDLTGFALLSLAVGSLQIMLDRGSIKDWFGSTEIIVEATVAALAFYLFIVHSATVKQPFVHLSLYRDRNYLAGNLLIFVMGMVLFATLALLPTLLQVLLRYPVFEAGLLTAPRSLGTVIAMTLVSRVVGKVDPRIILAVGFLDTAVSLRLMMGFETGMDARPIFWTGMMQGAGIGIAYVPMATIAFATLPTHLRNEGTALFNLMRNLGSSIGISAVQALLIRQTQVMHASLAEHVSPYNLANRDPLLAAQLATGKGVAAVNAALSDQAAMVAYIDDFKLMLILTVLAMPLLLLVRRAAPQAAQATPHVALD
jgi:DHA2 family multidrug resistance protein